MGDTTRIPLALESVRSNSLAGNAFVSEDYLSTADQDMAFLVFLADVDGKAYYKVTIPNTIGATPAAKIILVVAANATTGVSRMSCELLPTINGEGLNRAKTTVTAQDITVENVAYETKEVSFTVPTTGDFPVVAEDILDIEIFHEGAHANDTLAVDTLIKEAYLEIDLS